MLAVNWNLPADGQKIRGTVRKKEEGIYLCTPHNEEGHPLSYPSPDDEDVSDSESNPIRIRDDRAEAFDGEQVVARIELASEEKQRRRGNPWLVEVTEIMGRVADQPSGPENGVSAEAAAAEENEAEQIFQSAKQTPSSKSSSQQKEVTYEKREEFEQEVPSKGREHSNTASSSSRLTAQQAAQLNDAERMNYLMKQWDLSAPILRGTLVEAKKLEHTTIWELQDVQDLNGNALSYPVEGLKGRRAHSFFAGLDLSFTPGVPVEARFKLSSDDTARQYNPLAVQLQTETIERLTSIPESFVQHHSDGSVAVRQSLYDYHVEQKKEQIEEELTEAVAGLDDQRREKKEQLAEAEQALEDVRKRQSQREDKAEEASAKASKLEGKAEGLKREVRTLYEERNRKQAEIDREIKAQLHHAQQKKAQLMNDVFKLRNYVTRRADQLHRLDLISDKQRGNLVDDAASRTPDEDALSFSDDLDGDFGRLVDHVQAYLLDDGILYPRFLMEDFLTLLRTHDLIVLSGLSGSGKTQLVHSFAEAISGEARVIPVKPNWTSSEDLLGYYNPLQKSYLTTPFLDALIEARRNPETLYLLCLDEMNLSRVEYYFADFLSKLEERKKTPELPLYSTEEAGHVEAEFRALMGVIDEAEDQQNGEVYENFGDLLRDEEISALLQERLGIESGKSFVELHAHLRRMLAGVLNVPAALELPPNVRFIGAINMDQTTNALATKVLDRAHVVRFESAMTYDWDRIREQAEATDAEPAPIDLPASQLTPPRAPYPGYDPKNDALAAMLRDWTDEYLRPIGVDIGLRTVRQAANYRDLLRDVHTEDAASDLHTRALNSILLRKILPRFSFEGERLVSASGDGETRHERVQDFRVAVRTELKNLDEEAPVPHAARALDDLIERAGQGGAVIYNYWG